MVLDLAAGRAEAADTFGDLKGPGTTAELERLADQGTGRAGVDAVAAEIAVQRFTGQGINYGAITAINNLDGLTTDNFATDLDTFFAQDAAVGVTFQQPPVVTDRQTFQFGAVLVLINLEAEAGILQIAPSLTGVLQAVMKRSTPSTLTTQIRQAPVVETFFSQQRVGILMPSFAAASRIVAPTGTVTCVPSMVNVAVVFLSLDSVCAMPISPINSL